MNDPVVALLAFTYVMMVLLTLATVKLAGIALGPVQVGPPRRGKDYHFMRLGFALVIVYLVGMGVGLIPRHWPTEFVGGNIADLVIGFVGAPAFVYMLVPLLARALRTGIAAYAADGTPITRREAPVAFYTTLGFGVVLVLSAVVAFGHALQLLL